MNPIKARLKDFRARLGLHQKEVVADIQATLGIRVALRSFQNWENCKVSLVGRPARTLADYYSVRLGEEITPERILNPLPDDPVFEPELQAAIDLVRSEVTGQIEELRSEIRTERDHRVH